MLIGNHFILQKRKNATEYEAKTNKCIRYDCNNETGPVPTVLVHCNETPACYEGPGKCDETSGECSYNKKKGWEELIKLENHCFEVVCENDEWVLTKRANATEWEGNSTKCVICQCLNESGPSMTDLCSNKTTSSSSSRITSNIASFILMMIIFAIFHY